jgi:endonuclease
MAIYDKPCKVLMTEWANENLKRGQNYTKNQIADWFLAIYPKFKRNSVLTDIDAMSVNYRSRIHYAVKPGSGHDLFFKEGPSHFRLWEPERDPPPIYKDGAKAGPIYGLIENDESESSDAESNQSGDTFALEKDLQNFLVRNLHRLEAGLKLYEVDGLSGIEYNAGGRFIDILAVDKEGDFVVIELKVSKGYDRVIGQLLRYMGWVESNLADHQSVRGMIVCSEITQDLVLATSHIADRVSLFEYSLTFNINVKER